MAQQSPTAMREPYRAEDTDEGAWTVYSNEPTKSMAGLPLETGRIVTVYVGKTAREVAEAVADTLNQEAARKRQREPQSEDVTTIKAVHLKSGFSVKAPGAPAWSAIRSISGKHVVGGTITAHLDWGTLVYREGDDVEVLV